MSISISFHVLGLPPSEPVVAVDELQVGDHKVAYIQIPVGVELQGGDVIKVVVVSDDKES